MAITYQGKTEVSLPYFKPATKHLLKRVPSGDMVVVFKGREDIIMVNNDREIDIIDKAKFQSIKNRYVYVKEIKDGDMDIDIKR